MANEKNIVVLVTAKNAIEAETIARALLEKKLAACCNMIDGVRSLFHWEGKICDEREVLLIIKTRRILFNSLEKAIRAVHSYETPEIIALPITAGSAAYLKWLRESVLL
ncbi:MAG: divalent-cation tolerance protein CutA [Candidatus Omnitrophica bacterium]|nr:divalent-cation tolerance protein CutA [Candidatus Omnitrophota bacterium]